MWYPILVGSALYTENMHTALALLWICYSLSNHNTLRPRQMAAIFQTRFWNAFHFNENMWIFIKMSLKFVLKGPINNISAMVQIMTWRRPGDKPLFEPMLVNILTHICVTWPQWVNQYLLIYFEELIVRIFSYCYMLFRTVEVSRRIYLTPLIVYVRHYILFTLHVVENNVSSHTTQTPLMNAIIFHINRH